MNRLPTIEHDVGQGDRDTAVEQRAEARRVGVGQQAARVAGRGDGEAGRLDEAPQRRPGARPERPAPGHDDGPLGGRQQRDRPSTAAASARGLGIALGRDGGRLAAASGAGASSTSVGSST